MPMPLDCEAVYERVRCRPPILLLGKCGHRLNAANGLVFTNGDM